MDDNARPHRARIVREFRQQQAIDTFQWPAMSPNMNPVEHAWDFIDRKVNQRNPECQNIAELTNAILKEWRRFPQERLPRLVRGMNRRVWELWCKRRGYTRYLVNVCDKASPYHSKVLKKLGLVRFLKLLEKQ